jgi:hypothetical protein
MLLPRFYYGYARAIQLIAIFGILVLFLLMQSGYSESRRYRYTDGKTSAPWDDAVLSMAPSPEAAYLKLLAEKYFLTQEIPWLAKRIRPSYTSAKRQSMTNAKLRFATSGFQRVRVGESSTRLRAERSTPLAVTKSPLQEQDTTLDVLFGISTTYSRLAYSNYSLINDWERWLTDGHGKSNGASLVLALHRASEQETNDITYRLKGRGVDVTMVESDDRLEIPARYIELIRSLATQNAELLKRGHEKKFIALVDDDLFFPTLSQLKRRLSKYDTSKEFYISAPSERSDWIVDKNVSLTYGGGAVFLTPPAADGIARLPCLGRTKSKDTGHFSAQWDLLLYDCVAQHTNLNMHVMPSFYSPRDSFYGIEAVSYEAGVSPLTLHHYKNRHRFEPGKAHRVASVCGEDCFLQRYRFTDDWILVNGYSISQYLDGVDVVPMRKGARLLDHNYHEEKKLTVSKRMIIDEENKGVNNRKIVTWGGRKLTWRFLDSIDGPNGELWQAYIRRRGSPGVFADGDDRIASDVVHTNEEPSDVDSLIVLIWESS